MKLEHKSFAFSRKADDGLKENEFSGYGAVFNNLDSHGDIIMPGAFAETLPEFLQTGVIGWQHKWADPIGKPIEAAEDANGLYIKGRISETSTGKDALTLLRDDVIKRLSIGYRTIESKWFDTLDSLKEFAALNAMKLKLDDLEGVFGGVRVLIKVKLYEVSLVTVPANTEAIITGVKDHTGLIQQVKALVSGLEPEQHSEAMVSMLTGFEARMRANHEARVKEGRVISEANRTRIKSCLESLDALESVKTALRELLDVSAAPASDDGKADDSLIAEQLALFEITRMRHIAGLDRSEV